MQACINKTRDAVPALVAHSSAEVVKGSLAPAYKCSLTLQTEAGWRIRRTCLSYTQTANYMLYLYLWACVCVWVHERLGGGGEGGLLRCLDNQFPFFRLPLEPWAELTHTNAGAEIRIEGGAEKDTGLSSERRPRLSHLPSPVKLQMWADCADMSAGRVERNTRHLRA